MIENIIFDLGGVLVDWDLRYLYKKIFKTDEEIEHFINEIFPFSYNHRADAGELLVDICEEVSQIHPEYREAIFAYAARWDETLGEEFSDNVQVMRSLKSDYRMLALTNWSAETIPFAKEKFDFFKDFEGIVVSGEEKCAKPDKKIFEILLKRFNIEAHNSVFIDDKLENISTAADMGFKTVHCTREINLKAELNKIIGDSNECFK